MSVVKLRPSAEAMLKTHDRFSYENICYIINSYNIAYVVNYIC